VGWKHEDGHHIDTKSIPQRITIDKCLQLSELKQKMIDLYFPNQRSEELGLNLDQVICQLISNTGITLSESHLEHTVKDYLEQTRSEATFYLHSEKTTRTTFNLQRVIYSQFHIPIKYSVTVLNKECFVIVKMILHINYNK